MATIAVSLARGSGVGRRPHINGLQYIEISTPRGSGVCGDTKIRSGVGAGQIIVDAWTPTDGSFGIDHLHSIRAELHANPNTIEFEKLYDNGDFSAGGILTDVTEIGDGVQLATVAPGTDFEDYNIARVDDGAQPEVWTYRASGVWYWWVIAAGDGDSWDGQHIRTIIGNGETYITYNPADSLAAGIISVDWFADSLYGTGRQGICTNITGSGGALRGHSIGINAGGNQVYVYRINSDTSESYIASVSLGFTPTEDVPYRLKIKFTTNGSTTWWYYKFWLLSSSEPGSYTYIGQDTVYIAAGAVGLASQGGASSAYHRYDNFKVELDPEVHASSGDWTSHQIDTTSIGNYSHALIEWDETTPTDTTAAVKARWRNGGTWLACTNGDQIPGIDLGEDMLDGNSKDSLELKIELATTDTASTPLVENLHFYHEPLSNLMLNIEVDGVDHIEADGNLEIWGKRQIDTGVEVIKWDDITAETIMAYKLQLLGSAMLIRLIYNDVEIDNIVIDMAFDYWMVSSDRTGIQFSMDPIKYASAPIQVRWVVQTPWASMGHNYEWILIDKSIAIHADVWWICGHYQINDHPGSVQVGVVQRTDYPGSVQVKGWKRNDHLGSALVQGWRINDIPGMVLPGVWYRIDFPGSMLVGERVISDTPGSVIVYAVNRDGHIEVDAIDATTWAAMVAAGYGVEQ